MLHHSSTPVHYVTTQKTLQPVTREKSTVNPYPLSWRAGRSVLTRRSRGALQQVAETADWRHSDIFITLRSHVCIVVSFDLQILLLRHLLLSLPWRHLDPEVKQIRFSGFSSCCSVQHKVLPHTTLKLWNLTKYFSDMVFKKKDTHSGSKLTRGTRITGETNRTLKLETKTS